MGAAVAEVVKDGGAEVVVMDRADIALDGVKAIHLDLSDKASIDAAVDECGGPIHALFSCAGLPPQMLAHQQLLDGGQRRQEVGLLEDDANLFTPQHGALGRRDCGDVFAVDDDDAMRRHDERGSDGKQR